MIIHLLIRALSDCTWVLTPLRVIPTHDPPHGEAVKISDAPGEQRAHETGSCKLYHIKSNSNT